ncbi:histidine phosphatase family protein [bacterium]|nr:histidine phosphatase family protein [bacterium]
MNELYLLRHAETEANLNGILQGHLDYPLSGRGLEQASAVAERLTRLEVDRIFRSPSGRVAATLAPARKRGLPEAVVHKGLLEIDLGIASGLTFDEFRQRYAEELSSDEYLRGEYRFPGGESRLDLYNRAETVWNELLATADERILIASHGGILSQLLAVVLGIPNDGKVRFRLDNASLTKIAWHNGHPYLTAFNDCAHLAEGLRSPPFTPRLMPETAKA